MAPPALSAWLFVNSTLVRLRLLELWRIAPPSPSESLPLKLPLVIATSPLPLMAAPPAVPALLLEKVTFSAVKLERDDSRITAPPPPPPSAVQLEIVRLDTVRSLVEVESRKIRW